MLKRTDAGPPGLNRIIKAMEVYRVRYSVNHTTTGIVTIDKTEQGFDCHAILPAADPMLRIDHNPARDRRDGRHRWRRDWRR